MAGIAYVWNLSSDLMARFKLGSTYTSACNSGSDLNPLKQQEAFAPVNVGFTIGALSKRRNVEFWVRNLTNPTYSQVRFDAPLQTSSINVFLGAPSTYGMTPPVQR